MQIKTKRVALCNSISGRGRVGTRPRLRFRVLGAADQGLVGNGSCLRRFPQDATCSLTQTANFIVVNQRQKLTFGFFIFPFDITAQLERFMGSSLLEHRVERRIFIVKTQHTISGA